MKKILFLLFNFLALTAYCQYNNIIASQMTTQFIEADYYAGEDNQSYQYFIKNNVVFKLKGAEKWQYKNITLGKIKRVDLHNPMRILVFYENFNTVIALDNQLNEIQRINFNEIGNGIIAAAVGTAGMNSYWMFDANIQQLFTYNYISNVFQKIGNVFEKPIKDYHSNFNYFFWIDTDNHLYQSDLFGKKTLVCKIPDFDSIHLTDEKIIVYQKSEKLYLFDLEKQKSIPVEIVQKSIKSFQYQNQNLAIFTAEGITNYKINLP